LTIELTHTHLADFRLPATEISSSILLPPVSHSCASALRPTLTS
jgi:hypothetical protein